MSAVAVPTQYGPVASVYEERIVPKFRPIADALLAAAEPTRDDRVVEIGAGTGGLSRLVAARLGPAGRLVLTDVAPEVLEIAGRVLAADAPTSGPSVELVIADLRALPFADGSFDRYLAMLTPVQDSADGLAEAHRVLRPGGRFAIAFWGQRYAEVELLNAARAEVDLPPNRATPRATVVERLRRLGFGTIRSETRRLPIVHDDAETYLAYRRAFGSPRDISADTYARYEAALRRRVERISPGGAPVVLDWTIVIVTARA